MSGEQTPAVPVLHVFPSFSSMTSQISSNSGVARRSASSRGIFDCAGHSGVTRLSVFFDFAVMASLGPPVSAGCEGAGTLARAVAAELVVNLGLCNVAVLILLSVAAVAVRVLV